MKATHLTWLGTLMDKHKNKQLLHVICRQELKKFLRNSDLNKNDNSVDRVIWTCLKVQEVDLKWNVTVHIAVSSRQSVLSYTGFYWATKDECFRKLYQVRESSLTELLVLPLNSKMNGISFACNMFLVFGFNKLETSIFHFSGIFSLLHWIWQLWYRFAVCFNSLR